MEFIPYSYLAVLLCANIWLLVQIRDIIAKRNKLKTYTIFDLVFAFIKEKDYYFMGRPLTPQMPETKEWLLRHSVSNTDHEALIFRYLEEWANMDAVLRLIDLDDLIKQLSQLKFKLRKEVLQIPMESDDFNKKVDEIKTIEGQIRALDQIKKSHIPRPPQPPQRPRSISDKPNPA